MTDDDDIMDIAREIVKVKHDLESHKKETLGVDGESISLLLEKMEEERQRSYRKIEELHSTVREQVDGIRDEIKMSISEKPSGEAGKDAIIEEHGLEAPAPRKTLPPSRKDRKPKKKVLKKGKQAVAVLPEIGLKEATEAARKNLKRSFFRGPKENIDDVRPVYLPLYRFLIGFKGNLLQGDREGDLFIDGSLGEIVVLTRSGLKRSRGLNRLLGMTDLETRVYRAAGNGKKEDMKIAKRASMAVKDTRRALTSLQKKGIITKTTIEGNVNLFEVSENVDIPRKPWARDSGIEPDMVEGIEETLVDPLISEKDVNRMISRLSGKFHIIQSDLVRYPFYLITITGQGRTRYIAIDGVTGKIDDDLKRILPEIVPLLSV